METTPIETIRHSLAHLLAMSILELDPKAKLGTGPATDTGFFYDFEFSKEKPFSENDFKSIEKIMRKLINKKIDFTREEISETEAKKLLKDQPYKLELVEEIAKRGEKISIYKTADFVDLCEGPHVKNTGEIPADAFKLTRIAGAYWKSDESKTQLTRITGIAFESKAALEKYQWQQEEAKKRDHRKLGAELELFTFDDQVGPGLPLWLPKGTVIADELEMLAKETETRAGYLRVRTPHIAKDALYQTSGHLPYYEDSMFPPMEYEGEKYYLKAMNCPHHHKIFAASPKSYRDLPLRLAEYGTVYRHEKSGELFGLMRVRMMQMNDAHIYCTEEQFAEEFRAVNDLYLRYFKIFGIEKYLMRFSTHSVEKLGKKYVNEPELWKKTEDMVRTVLKESNIPFVEIPDEAAFYGPKIDVQVWSAIGREFTLATNQVDFAVPARFGLTYTDSEGQKQTPLCIHRAPLGTHERFIGFLIEHYAGAFPFWLSPVQIAILPIGETHEKYAEELAKTFRDESFRVEIHADESLGKRIRETKIHKIPYTLVVGDQEIESKTASVESRDNGKLGNLPIEEVLSRLKKEEEEKR
jgi:threonyl-tRNA synthetase